MVVEVGDEHAVGALAGADGVSVGVDGFEDDEVVGEVDAVAAEAAEHTLGHGVAVGDRCVPGLLDDVTRFGQEWFGDGDDAAGCDVQTAALGFHRQAWKKGAVGHEHRWLQLVEPVDDLLEREVDGEQMPCVITGRERLAQRRGDVRRAGGGHDGDHTGDLGQRRIEAPVPGLEADVRRVASRPRLPAVGEHPTQARRAAGGHDLELVHQMVAGVLVEMVFAQASRQAGIGDDGIEVVHQIRLGHHRQIDDVESRERGDVETAEPAPMPGRPFNRCREQRSQRTRPLNVEPSTGPIDTGDILG